MIEISNPRDLARLRRLALAAQGLLQAQPFGSGLAGARKAINHLGYVQIDTISVVERAHHHVLHSRVPQFTPAMTNTMLLDRDIFEYWVHAAAFIPIADFRFSLPAKQAIKSDPPAWYAARDQQLMNELMARIRSDGPIRSRDIETNASKRAGWWDWKPAKRALEQLYLAGDLMVCNREGFQKSYDLPERVLPSSVNTAIPSSLEWATHIVDQQLRCQGLATLSGLTYQRRNLELRAAVTAVVAERLAQGAMQQLQLQSGEVFLVETGALERTTARVNNRLLILSPFDNAVIQRERLRALFQFDYQIECYLPEAKRQYGYFSLPLLYRDRFVGRVDCKAHRKIKHLEVKALFLEPPDSDEDALVAAFARAIHQFRDFQGCDSVSLTQAHPGRLTDRLNSALNSALNLEQGPEPAGVS